VKLNLPKELKGILMRMYLIFLFVCLSISGWSQTASRPLYPRNYFINPVNLPMEIVANMGELRSNHWHMGLDIRTNQKENQVIKAAADGFISHIGIRPQSFGRFIVIDHPNGLSTLYAHLNDFFPELEKYVTNQQYSKETWAIELDLDKKQFPVSRGQFIAYSGNTGGSQGPHLHFEIMETKTGTRLNPLLFGFPLVDKVPPSLLKLALYDRGKPLYSQSPSLYTLKNTDSGYIIPKIEVLKTGLRQLSFGLQAFDRISGSKNEDGIYSAELSIDGKPQVKFVIDSIDYVATQYMNAHIDYRHRYKGGAYIQHLSKLPGDHSNVYKIIGGDGVLRLADTLLHEISIEVRDAYQNISILNFLLQFDDSLAGHGFTDLPPAFIPNEVNVMEVANFEAYLPEGCLYDTVEYSYFHVTNASEYALSRQHRLHDESVPLHGEMTIRIKPERTIPQEWNNKLVVQRNGKSRSVRKASLENGWLTAKFGDFGSFQAFVDLVPPTVNKLGKGDTINLSASKRIVFTPKDNFGIRQFRAELNGQWLRFTNDKGRSWVYEFDERVPYGTHELKITVEDLVGNSLTETWWFKRGPYTPPKKKAVKKKSSKKVPRKKR
jgi:murein DD-endopeptidase MepM/ murein hydrolase activator NlpD